LILKGIKVTQGKRKVLSNEFLMMGQLLDDGLLLVKNSTLWFIIINAFMHGLLLPISQIPYYNTIFGLALQSIWISVMMCILQFLLKICIWKKKEQNDKIKSFSLVNEESAL